VLDFVISSNIAFNAIDNPAFQELLALIDIDGLNGTVNRRNIRELLTTESAVAHEELLLRLVENESKVSLALDCWTSCNNFAFLGMCL
jgi:hypothetical protein